MSHVDNTPGNILIRHNDKWRGNYYLKDDFTFTTNRNSAGRFYILKPGDTTIINGDRIGIHTGNRTLVIDDNNIVRLVDRDNIIRELHSFIVTNGTDNTDPITYESSIFVITDKDQKTALRYTRGINFIRNNNGTDDFKPHEHPNLVNGNYGGTSETHIDPFQFYLERADGPITNLNTATTYVSKSSNKTVSDHLEDYRGAIMIVLLMIILILCLLASK